MVALFQTMGVLRLLPSAAGVYIFRRNMYRLMGLVANGSSISALLCFFARFVLAPEAFAEGVSRELVCCDLKLDRSE